MVVVVVIVVSGVDVAVVVVVISCVCIYSPAAPTAVNSFCPMEGKWAGTRGPHQLGQIPSHGSGEEGLVVL